MKHKLTRLTSLLLALIMSFSMLLVPAYASEFADVPANAWYEEAVDYVQENGWMKGVSANSFAPNAEVTRAMFVTVLARYAKADVNDEQTTKFDDVPSGTWYTGAVAWAAEKGIVNGVSANAFAPNRAISRQELCTMLARFINKQDYELKEGEAKSFTDAASIADFAKDAVAYCARTGLVAGYTDGSFRPTATASRAQTAMILMRLDKAIKGETEEPVPMPAQNFDVTVDDVQVVVEAPEGALPAGTEMSVELITDVDRLAELADIVNKPLYIVTDICFKKDNVEIEPLVDVKVRMIWDGLDQIENPTVIHVKDDGNAEPVETEVEDTLPTRRAASRRSVLFYSKDFSIYLITDGETITTPRATYHFLNELSQPTNGTATPYTFVDKAGQTVDYQILKGDEYLEDVGTPVTGLDKNFLGWFVATKSADADTYTYTNTKVTFGEGTTPPQKATDYDIDVYVAPRFGQAFIVTFWDKARGSADMHVVAKRLVYLDDNATTASVRVDDVSVPSLATETLTAWTSYNYAETETTKTLLEAPTWDEVKGDFDLYPKFSPGHWLRFMGGQPGWHAGYRSAIFVTANTTAAEVTNLGTVTREGYNFVGWYTGSNDELGVITYGDAVTGSDGVVTNPSDLLDTVNAAETTLYAKWEGKSVKYTVATWFENPDDNGYSFGAVDTNRTGTAGTVTNVTASDVSGFTAQTIEQKEINGDGTTVINIYYKRNVYSIYFHSSRQNSQNNIISALTITAKYGADIHDQWPGTKQGTESYGAAWYVATSGGVYMTAITTMPLNGANYYQMSGGQNPLNTIYMIQSVNGGNSFTQYVQAPYYGGNAYTTADDYTAIKGFQLNAYNQNDANAIKANATGDDDAVYDRNFNRSAQIGSYYLSGSTNEPYYYNRWNNNYQDTVNGYYTLYFYYLRKQYDIIFDKQLPTAPAVTADFSGIYYEANIQNVKAAQISALNNQYVVGTTKVEVENEGTYVFQGWYDNAACLGDPFDFNKEMPAGNITLFAKWERVYYLIEIEPRGGEILPEVLSEVTYTWLQYGQKIERYNIQRNYVETDASFEGDKYYFVEVLASDDPHANDTTGYFWSGYRNSFYVKTTEVDSLPAFYRDNGFVDTSTLYRLGDTNDNYSFVGWYNKANDELYDFNAEITGATAIYARWRRSGLFNVKYNFENTIDGVKVTGHSSSNDIIVSDTGYADQAETNIVYRPSNIVAEDGKTYVFVGWKLLKDTSETPTVYQQKDKFVVDSKYADNNHDIELIALYELASANEDTLPVTTVTFNSNFPANATVTSGETKTIEGVPLNTAINLGEGSFTIAIPNTEDRIETIPVFSCVGYTMTGWNTKADGTGTAYKLTDTVGVDNADPTENTLYAVWQRAKYFYVFHSSSGVLEAVNMGDALVDGKYNLQDVVAEGHYYGGYYPSFGGIAHDDVVTAKTAFSNGTETGWTLASAAGTGIDATKTFTVDDGFAAYTGKSLKNGETKFWTKTQAHTEDGTQLAPVEGTVYYLKEVPNCYLPNKLIYIWDKDTHEINNIYLLTAVDDNCYSEIGFTVDGEYWERLALSTKFTVNLYSNGVSEPNVYTAEDLGVGQRGYIAVYQLKKDFVDAHKNSTFIMTPSWTTMDNVKVPGSPVLYIVNPGGTEITWNLDPVRHFDGTEKLYFNLNPTGWAGTDAWDACQNRIYLFTGSGDDASKTWVDLIKTSESGKDYEATIPEGNWKNVIIVRCDPTYNGDDLWKSKWNQSGNIDIPIDTSNYLTSFAEDSKIATWGTYPAE